jgi:HEAT repeat protein
MLIITKAASALAVLALAAGAARQGPRLPEADPLPPASWATQDVADSLYRAARDAMGRGEYGRASELFERIAERHPSSAYAADALYYQAFSLYRSGGSDDLKRARKALKDLKVKDPKYNKRGDIATLDTRICGELARRGDAGCAAEVSRLAEDTDRDRDRDRERDRDDAARERDREQRDRDREARERANESRERAVDRTRADRPAAVAPRAPSSDCPKDDDDDERVAALNALLQMNAERAVPILKRVLERRDECSVVLRRKAVFLISQKRSAETADVLMDLARNDPDREVREQAVFWLSQVPGERTLELLSSILRDSRDATLQDKALFAISQHQGERGAEVLRDYATRDGAPEKLREQAIFWLGQRRSSESAEFLRALYPRLRSQQLKDKVIFSLSQQRGLGNDRWLMDRALDTREPIELRKQALFWASQMGGNIEQLVELYNRVPDHEVRNHLIFIYSQRRERAAVDKLLDIAKNERDSELRKQAIFWLSQSRDPRAQQFLLDIIEK